MRPLTVPTDTGVLACPATTSEEALALLRARCQDRAVVLRLKRLARLIAADREVQLTGTPASCRAVGVALHAYLVRDHGWASSAPLPQTNAEVPPTQHSSSKKRRGKAGERPPRLPRTPEEASAKNAEKYNTRQRSNVPLFMEAGGEADLLRTGVIVDRQPDHQLRLSTALFDRLAAGDREAALHAEAFRKRLKLLRPDAYREALLQLRRLRSFPSMRRPVNTADHWHTSLRKALSREEYLAVLDDLDPRHAAVVRHIAEVNARLARKSALGQYNSWFGGAKADVKQGAQATRSRPKASGT